MDATDFRRVFPALAVTLRKYLKYFKNNATKEIYLGDGRRDPC